MTHVFISFVEENVRLASWVAKQLRANGLEPWFAKDAGRILPGDQWRQKLRAAIQEGGFYVPLFTREWAARQRTVANEELTVAVEEARLRGLHRRWFIPIKVDEAPLPVVELGGGLSLSDLHHVDLPKLGWEGGLRSLLAALGTDNPILDAGEPLAPGFGAAAEITGGFVTYRNTEPAVTELEGVTFTATGGYVRRDEAGRIFGNFRLRAPFEALQAINSQFGFDSIDVVTDDPVVSTDPERPTYFKYIDEKDVRPPGSPLWVLGEKNPIKTDVSLAQQTGYDAYGHVTPDNKIVGQFSGYVDSSSVLGSVRFSFDGDFEFSLRPVIAPPG